METERQEGSSPLDAFAQLQKTVLSSWGEAAEHFQKAWKKVEWPTGDAGEMFKTYNAWKESFGKCGAVFPDMAALHTPADTLAKLFGSTDAFAKLYEFWKPLVDVLQEQSFDPDAYKAFLDPAKYKEVVDKIFGFRSPESLAEFLGPLSKLADLWTSKGQGSMKLVSDMAQQNLEAWRGLASGDPQAAAKLFHGFDTFFESSLGKVLKAPPIGMEREQIELLFRTVDRYKVFVVKNAELQQEIYAIAQKALGDVIKDMAQKIKQEGHFGGFLSFLDLWMSVNERAFLALFKTDQFSKLQGTVLEAALDARRYNQRLLESYMGHLPIALRSEMDDTYKTIHDLRKRVAALERKIAQADEARAETAPPKKNRPASERR